MFERVKNKKPKIEFPSWVLYRSTKYPGCIGVSPPGYNQGWYARIKPDGSLILNDRIVRPINLEEELRQFAADPVGYAADYGQHSSNCCFCGTTIESDDSLAVGYGPMCAKKWGLPWGIQPLRVQDKNQSEQKNMNTNTRLTLEAVKKLAAEQGFYSLEKKSKGYSIRAGKNYTDPARTFDTLAEIHHWLETVVKPHNEKESKALADIQNAIEKLGHLPVNEETTQKGDRVLCHFSSKMATAIDWVGNANRKYLLCEDDTQSKPYEIIHLHHCTRLPRTEDGSTGDGILMLPSEY